jgi:dTDP-4-amino-4,6-dideoxygalactose transaminase
LSRDLLLKALRAENVVARRYFFPGAHRSIPWVERSPVTELPSTDRLCRTLVQFPIGALVSNDDVATLCGLLRAIRQRAADIRKAA